MSEIFRCGDNAALVGYLYDECEPDERQAIAAHVLRCRTCAEELEALSSTRQQLSAWTPPDARLGFRITRDTPGMAVDAAGTGLSVDPVITPNGNRPRAGWWHQPMPAWAQLAAAVLVFAAGLAVGTVRGSTVLRSTAPGSTALGNTALGNTALGSTALGNTAAMAASIARHPTVAALQDTVVSLEQRVAGMERSGQIQTAAAEARERIGQPMQSAVFHSVADVQPYRATLFPDGDIVTVPLLDAAIAASEKRQEQQMAYRLVQFGNVQEEKQQHQSRQFEVKVNAQTSSLARMILASAPR